MGSCSWTSAWLRELEEEDSGTVGIGTPRFMAPEVFAGGTVSPRSDVFGLAATLWTLIAGKPPVYAEPTKLSEICPDVSPELEQTIRAGLEMIPERRVASIGAFAKALGAELAPARGASLALSVEQARRSAQPDGGRRAHRGGRLRGRRVVDRPDGPHHRRARLPVGLGRGRPRDRRRAAAAGNGHRRRRGGSGRGSGRAATAAATRASPRRSPPAPATCRDTMLVVPLLRAGAAIGALSLLDRRDGGFYGSSDMERATMFAELAVTALDVEPDVFTSLGNAEDPEWQLG